MGDLEQITKEKKPWTKPTIFSRPSGTDFVEDLQDQLLMPCVGTRRQELGYSPKDVVCKECMKDEDFPDQRCPYNLITKAE